MSVTIDIDSVKIGRAGQVVSNTWGRFRPGLIKQHRVAQAVLEVANYSHSNHNVHLGGTIGLDACDRLAHDLFKKYRAFEKTDGSVEHDYDYGIAGLNHRLNCETLFLVGNTMFNQFLLEGQLKTAPTAVELPKRKGGIDWKPFIKSEAAPWPSTPSGVITLEGLVLGEMKNAWRNIYGDSFCFDGCSAKVDDLPWERISIAVISVVYDNIRSLDDLKSKDKLVDIFQSVHEEMLINDLWGPIQPHFRGGMYLRDLSPEKQEKYAVVILGALSGISDFMNPNVG
jgi:hypothetical protein